MRYVKEESDIMHGKHSCSQTASCDAEVPVVSAVSADATSSAEALAVAAEGRMSAASQGDAAFAIIVNPSPEP
jgi:hypothetical protein